MRVPSGARVDCAWHAHRLCARCPRPGEPSVHGVSAAQQRCTLSTGWSRRPARYRCVSRLGRAAQDTRRFRVRSLQRSTRWSMPSRTTANTSVNHTLIRATPSRWRPSWMRGSSVRGASRAGPTRVPSAASADLAWHARRSAACSAQENPFNLSAAAEFAGRTSRSGMHPEPKSRSRNHEQQQRPAQM